MPVAIRVLLVEDDARIRRALGLALREEGHDVVEAATGSEGLDCALDPSLDVVLLDLMLPDVDGFTVCRRIRRGSDVPIIMVTARTDSHDVVAGLEAGADDYVTKPLVGKELAARIRALLRRASRTASGVGTVDVGPLRLEPEQARVWRDGRELHLTRTEFKLLNELADNLGAVCSREALLEKVWGYDYFGDGRLVDVHVRRLRTKVEPDAANPRHVVTVRGLGYKLQP